MNKLMYLTMFFLYFFQAFLHADGVPGKIISYGMEPFTETLEDMHKRDQQKRACDKLKGAPQVKEMPYPANQQNKVAHQTSHPNLVSSLNQLFSSQLSLTLTTPTIGINFKGISLKDEFDNFGVGNFPPDTMGAIGPNHFSEVINGAVGFYSKTGVLVQPLVTLTTFFTVGSYPRGDAFDPRVLYDKQSGRWFACALETNPAEAIPDFPGSNNNIILAVSRTDDPTGVWDKYIIPVAEEGFFTDYDTLGVDTNGVYFGMNMFGEDSFHAKIAATRIDSLLSPAPTLGPVYISPFYTVEQMAGCIQCCHNLDVISPDYPAWFVTSDPAFFGNILYLNFIWPNVGAPTFPDNFTRLPSPGYAGFPVPAPAFGSTVPIDTGDDRPLMAIIRSQRLWTTRNIGVDQTGNGIQPPDRTAAEFLSLNVSSPTASLEQSGRVFDNSLIDPRFYYYPSLSVNRFCNVVMGFLVLKKPNL